jgi:hypothetical protein
MFMGIGIMALTGVGAIAFIAATVWFVLTIGFLQTVVMYGSLTFIATFYRLYTRHRRHRIGFRTVHTWDTDEADAAGSTARGGIPHDPYGIIPRSAWTDPGKNRRE